MIPGVLGLVLLVGAPGAPGADVDGHPWLPGEEPASVSVGTVTGGHLVGGVAIPSDDPRIGLLPTQEARGLRYATAGLVSALARAAGVVAEELPGGRLWLGNLAAEAGGDIPWSRSHNTGRDADIAFHLVDTEGRPAMLPDLLRLDENGWIFTAEGAFHLDAPRTWVLVRALLTDPSISVQHLFISTPLKRLLLAEGRRRGASPAVLKRAGVVLVQPYGALPHDDHIHMRIHCTPLDAAHGCREHGRRRAGAPDIRGRAKAAARRALALFGDPLAETRRRAAHRVGLLGERRAARPLAGLLKDADAGVRRRAAMALVDIGATSQGRSLAAALYRETDGRTRAAMAAAVAELGASGAQTALRKLLSETGPDEPGLEPIRATAAALLAELGAGAAVPAIIDLLVDPEEVVRVAALDALVSLGNVDLGPSHDVWLAWWRRHRREPREKWLSDGFALAGFEVPVEPTREDASALLEAVASEERHVSLNARRVLMRLYGKRDRKQLMWSSFDARWWWRVAVRRSRSRS